MKLTVAHNPFDLTREQTRHVLLSGQTVKQGLVAAGLEDGRYILSCNGELLPPETAMDFVPRAGDDLMAVPQLQNGPLKAIAAIGIQVGAAFLAPGLGNFIGMTLFTSLTTAAQDAIAGALLSVGGSLALGGIASLFQKQPGGSTYGVLGPATTARSGVLIPKGFGTMRAAGNIVESWIDIQGSNGDAHDVDDGADTIGRQYINCRVDFGWGPARAFNNLQLNGKDITSFADVAYCLLYGTDDQAPVTLNDSRWVVLNRTTTGTTTNTQPTVGFDTINNDYPQDQRCRAGVANNIVVVQGQRDDTDQATVFVVFKEGVWRTDDSNITKRAAIDYDVLYRVRGSGDAGWQLAQHHYYYNIRQTLLRQATIIPLQSGTLYDYGVRKNGCGAVNNPIDAFEHESNKWGDELWIESVQETSFTTLAYPGLIQVCLRIMASSQISGSDLQLTADITYGLRSTLPAPIAALPEDAPAAVLYDILHDDIIGGGMDDSRIDLDFLADWGALTQSQVDNGDGGTQRLAAFNGVFDQDGKNIWQAASSVAVMGRANLQRIGTRVTGWLDAPDVPVQMFHMGTILLDSYEKTYLNLEDRAEEIEVQFADAADNYKTRNPLRIVTAADESSIVELKKTRVSLLGCTDRVQAYYWGYPKLIENKLVLRTHTWRCAAAALRAATGNIVLLQHDAPGYGWGGNVEPGPTTTVLLLDRVDLPFDSASAYVLIVQLPAVQRVTVNVIAVNGNVLSVGGYDGSLVNRAILGNVDTGIQGIAQVGSSSVYTLTVDDSTGIAAGAALGLWITDPMETHTVQSLQTVVIDERPCSRVTLATALSAVPPDDASYIYQSVTRQALKVRLKQIQKKPGDNRFTLTAVDYNPAIWTVPAPSAGMSYTPPAAAPPPSLPTPVTPGTIADANFSVSYTESEVNQGSRFDEPAYTYHVNGIMVSPAGSGYTSSSKFQLVSDYQQQTGSGTTTSTSTDPIVTLTAQLDSNGAVLALTGWGNVTWHDLPYVLVTR